jgi:hypothetical protein
MTRSGASETGIRRLPLRKLKCCPLCESVNARQNRECFVCGWRGTFEHDAPTIERGLAGLIERCPDLAGILLAPPRPASLMDRLVHWLRRRRRLDFRA